MHLVEVRSLASVDSYGNWTPPPGWLKILGIALVAIASYATGIIGS